MADYEDLSKDEAALNKIEKKVLEAYRDRNSSGINLTRHPLQNLEQFFHECDLLCKALIVVGVFAKTKAVRLLTGWHKSRWLQASSGSARRWRWTRIVSLHNPGG